MEGSFFDDLRQLESDFFAGEEKSVPSCVPVVSTSLSISNGVSPLAQGLYTDEESIDFSALLEACNNSPESHTAASTTNTSIHSTTIPVSAVPQSTLAVQSQFTDTFTTEILPTHYSSFVPTSVPTTSTNNQPSMYDAYGSQTIVRSNPPNLVEGVSVVPNTQTSIHVMPLSVVGTRRAPGKATPPSKEKKKRAFDKHTTEYRQKRDRNNVAVRKSREKTKERVLDTEKRVKELEEENVHLQSKITLLTKELNVLKSLFASAGVSHPPPLCFKEDLGGPHN